MPTRSEADYEPWSEAVNLPVADVVKTTTAEALNEWCLWLIVMGTHADTT